MSQAPLPCRLGAGQAPEAVGRRVRVVHDLGNEGVPVPRGWLIPAETLAALAGERSASQVTGIAAALSGGFGLRAVARDEDWSAPPSQGVVTRHPVDVARGGVTSHLATLWETARPMDAILAAGIGLKGTRGTAVRQSRRAWDELAVFNGPMPRIPSTWRDDGVWHVPRDVPLRRVPWRLTAVPWLAGVRRLLDAAWAAMQQGAFPLTAEAVWIEWCAPRRRAELVDVRPIEPALADDALQAVKL